MSGVVVLPGAAYAYEKLDLSDDAAHGVTASNLKTSLNQQCTHALLQCTDNALHFTLHGTAPTAAAGTNVGIEMAAGETYLIEGYENIENLRCINAVAGTDAVPKITFFHRG